jgi:hypothetical protein
VRWRGKDCPNAITVRIVGPAGQTGSAILAAGNRPSSVRFSATLRRHAGSYCWPSPAAVRFAHRVTNRRATRVSAPAGAWGPPRTQSVDKSVDFGDPSFS